MEQAGTNSACAMNITYDELKSNNIQIGIETQSFHINTYLREHEEIYETVISPIDKENGN